MSADTLQPTSHLGGASPRKGPGLRARLVLALILLSVITAGVIGVALWGLAQMRDSVRQTVEVDWQMSRLASNVAIQALLCRRYEKDVFLLHDSPRLRQGRLSEWQRANAQLGREILAFSEAAVTEEDRARAQAWRKAQLDYTAGFGLVATAIRSGELDTSEKISLAFEPYQANIAAMTDEAVAVAAEKEGMAQQAAAELRQLSGRLAIQLLVVGTIAITAALAWSLLFPSRLLRPIRQLQSAAARMSSGDMSARSGISRGDELGVLARSFDQMAATIEQRTADLQAQYAAAEEARAAAEHARARMVEQLDTIAEQRAVIYELSVPVLPLSSDTLVLPLVGALDSTRLALTQERALHAIERSRARRLILDITGVPVVDSQVAQGLLSVVHAARLLGARVALVGVRPEVAQAIVSLGLDLQGTPSFSDLQTALTTRG